ncbi:ester cyclase [Pendulispora brunnea]|uniref:Ester cyclase n=1 Tax=Pendulispora brunnea TaxID=2905690 RepID=A0ABZ2KC60_9BACT
MLRKVHSRALARYLGEAWSEGRIEVLDQVVHPRYVNHRDAQSMGPAGLKRIATSLREAFPDLCCDVHDEIHDGDRVAVRFTISGTHTGNLFGIAPTGWRVEIGQTIVKRFHEGKIIEAWRTAWFTNEERQRYAALQARIAASGTPDFAMIGNEFVLALAMQGVQRFGEAQRSGLDHEVRLVNERLALLFRPAAAPSPGLIRQLRECVRDVLAKGAGRTLSVSSVARQLGVSQRTLQRRLQEAGSSFSQEVDGVRRELACWYVADTDRPLSEIAFQLGFTEPGSFFRTFRRWTKTTPRRFRLGRAHMARAGASDGHAWMGLAHA